MYFNKIKGRIHNVKLSDAEQKALDEEIQRQLIAGSEKYSLENYSGILWALHEEFGFGANKLKRVMQLILENERELEEYYQLNKGDGGWVALKKLKDCGYDVESWYKEYGQEPVIEMVDTNKTDD